MILWFGAGVCANHLPTDPTVGLLPVICSHASTPPRVLQSSPVDIPIPVVPDENAGPVFWYVLQLFTQ
jgi:hypothetical protein